MTETILDVRTVAVIGAGVSGVAAAIHLKRRGLDVTVFERTAKAGGIWVFDERAAKDPAYPSTTPSVGDSPEYESLVAQSTLRADSPMGGLFVDQTIRERRTGNLLLSFAPPGPCYCALKNNVSTVEMEMTCQMWKPETEEFVPHHVLADYIQDSAARNGVLDNISFNTRVKKVRKLGSRWQVDIARMQQDDDRISISDIVELFDAVVVASGHYHACKVPDVPGLAEWKRRSPGSVSHSKQYRSSAGFEGKNVLLVGAGVSSMDIAKDLGSVARTVYQSSRRGPYDLPSHLLPPNGARVDAVESFELDAASELSPEESITGTVTLQSGQKLCGIHRVIVCTGYYVSFPFMPQYHADGVCAEDADEEVLVTDGQQTHNLHEDIFYIPDPTLAFIGVPYHVATFSCFEFQAMALAAVFAGAAALPSHHTMRKSYNERLKENGAGRSFHSLKKHGDEIAYVDGLTAMVNRPTRLAMPDVTMSGHTERWREAYARRRRRQEMLFSKTRDPLLDIRVLDMIEGC